VCKQRRPRSRSWRRRWRSRPSFQTVDTDTYGGGRNCLTGGQPRVMHAVPVEQLSADKSAKLRSRRPGQKADSCSRFHYNFFGLCCSRIARIYPPTSSSLAEERTPSRCVALLAPLAEAGADTPAWLSAAGARFPTLAASFHRDSGQATDSASRSREEITVETPSPRMLIPYKASAISIVRF
jgi:hypothetical protein